MVATLFRHELDLHRSHSARLAMTGLMMVLIALSVFRGGTSFHDGSASVREAAAAAREEWRGRPPDQWLSAGVRDGVWVFQPPLPSCVLTDGIARGRDAGHRVRVGLAQAHRVELSDGHASWSPRLGRFGSLDLGFVLTILAPLWAILLTFDAVSGEKERGTLRILFSHPLDRGAYLGAKAAGLVVWVVVPVSAALLAGFGLCAASGHFENGAVDPLRLAAFLATAFLYLAFWGMLGLWASTRGADSRGSLMLLLLLWVVFTFFLPRTAVIVGDLLHPTATKLEVDIARRALLAEARRVLDDDHHAPPPASWMEERVLVSERAIPMEVEADRAFAAEREASSRVKRRLASLSPMALASLALMDLAGTGERRHQAFLEQVDAYRRRLSAYFVATIRRQPVEAAVAFANIPAFEYREEAATEALGRTWPGMAWLALLTALAYGAALRGMGRYDLR